MSKIQPDAKIDWNLPAIESPVYSPQIAYDTYLALYGSPEQKYEKIISLTPAQFKLGMKRLLESNFHPHEIWPCAYLTFKKQVRKTGHRKYRAKKGWRRYS